MCCVSLQRGHCICKDCFGILHPLLRYVVGVRSEITWLTRQIVRLWSAIGRPPSIGIEVTVATIQGKLAEVNGEAMILLHSRGRDIYNTVQELKNDNKKLQETVDSSEERIIQLQEKNKELLDQIHEMKIASERKLIPQYCSEYQQHPLIISHLQKKQPKRTKSALRNSKQC